jgi:hypothetical protein
VPPVPTPGSLELGKYPSDELARLWDLDPESAERVEAALAALDRAPTAAANRRRQIRREAGGPLWGIDVRCKDHDLLILWEVDLNGTVVVQYLGPPLG